MAFCRALVLTTALVGGFVVHNVQRRPPVRLASRTQPEEDVLMLLGNGRVTLSKTEEAQLEKFLAELPEVEATAEALNGRWRLLYTTKSAFDARNPLGRRVDGTAPGLEALFDTSSAVASSSPIQRLLTSIESVDIEQNIDLVDDKRVDQIVKFGDNLLRLSATASFDSGRINFTFDLAYFLLFNGALKLPYPVPFKLLGDEAKGWLDTVFVSPTLRISKGNKGTTFVLKKLED